MDTVTESSLAIALALQGGLGVVHCNCTAIDQAQLVAKVKRYNNGFIDKPVTVKPCDRVSEILNMMEKLPFSSFPVTESGRPHSKLLGMVTKRDIEFVKNKYLSVSEVMTERNEICVGLEGCTLEEAFELVKSKKVNQLPIVDEKDFLVSLICKRDIKANMSFPNASRDKRTNQLLVGAAVPASETELNRVHLLIQAGVDILFIDSIDMNPSNQQNLIKEIKLIYPQVEVVADSITTAQTALRLIDAGADALRVGFGTGSTSIKQKVLGVGRAQVSSILSVVSLCNEMSPPIAVIADGGIKYVGDIVKALSLGASAVMMGKMFAGTKEASGKLTFREGVRLKKFCGSEKNSFGHLESNKDCSVLPNGSISCCVSLFVEDIKNALRCLGCNSLEELSDVRYELRTIGAIRESGVCGFDLFKEIERNGFKFRDHFYFILF